MAAGNDTGIFVGAFTFLLVAEAIIGAIGVETSNLTLPTGADLSATGANTNSFTRFVCSIPPPFIIIIHILVCNDIAFIRAIPIIGSVVDFLQSVVHFLIAAADFYIQFVGYQFTVLNVWLNLFIIVPPATTMTVIGLRFARGVS